MGFLRAVFVVVCFAVFSYVFCDDCVEGQSVWCRDLKQAIKCSAVNHCMTTVWKNEIAQEDPSEECVFCESIVQDVVKFIAHNESLEFIEKFLMDACDLIPITTISAECKMMVKEDLPYIIELIKEKVDPKVICGLLGFCKNQFNHFGVEKLEDEHFTIESNKKVVKDICQECKEFAKTVKENLLSKETEKRVLNFMNNVVCHFFIIGQEKCKKLATKYVTKLFDDLRRDFDPDILCAVFCYHSMNNPLNERAAHLFNMLKAPQSGCVMCNELKETIKRDLYDMKAMSQGGGAFGFLGTKICSAINGKETDECVSVVKTVGGKLLTFLSDERLDAVCRNLCGSDVPSETDATADESVMMPPSSSAADVNGDKCQTCQIVAQYLEALLDTDVVVSEIEHLVSKICTFLPKTMQPSCHTMIEEYGPIIVHYIAVYASPREVCKFINLCNMDRGEHHECIRGPNFWCVSPVNAKICVAEEYCKKHVWA